MHEVDFHSMNAATATNHSRGTSAAALPDRDAIEEIIRRNAKPEVTEEESTLAEEHRDGGEPSP